MRFGDTNIADICSQQRNFTVLTKNCDGRFGKYSSRKIDLARRETTEGLCDNSYTIESTTEALMMHT